MSTSLMAGMLASHGIRPTANRIMVAQFIAEAARPVCLADIEDALESVDKSNIFRALTLFREARLVHVIEDETGVLHYELCHAQPAEDDGHRDHDDVDDDEDLHVHFFCRVCRRMTCLHDIRIPPVELPGGYEAASATFIVKGVCPDCA